MSNQLQITGGAKVRNLEGVLTGTSGVVSSLGINVPSGIPQLDGSGKILVSQLPNSVMEYKGTWDASTNTPTLANGTGNQGDVYLCNVAGTVNFGAGPISFNVGDQVIYSGTIWQRASGATGTVTSVAVTESGDALTITGSPITTSGTINIGFAGTTGQYINGAGGLTTFPSLTGFVPYTGATANLDLGTFDLTTDIATLNQVKAVGSGGLSFNSNSGTQVALMGGGGGAGTTFYGGIIGTSASFASSGGSDTFAINHSSGSGIALNITKGGNGEGLYINKTSGSGNAATIIGTLNATTLVKNGGTSSQYLMADGSVSTGPDLTGYVTLATSQTISGAKTFTARPIIDQGTSSIGIRFRQYDNALYNLAGYTDIVPWSNDRILFAYNQGGTDFKSFTFRVNNLSLNTNRDYQMPNASGTLALSSDLSSYVPYSGATTNVNLGINSLSSGTSIFINGDNSTSGGYLAFKQFGSTSSGLAGYTSIYALSNNTLGITYNQSAGNIKTANFLATNLTVNTPRNYTLPDADGTLALTSNLTGYVQGSGTTNYIPKFTASGTIGNSSIIDNGTITAYTNAFYVYQTAGTGAAFYMTGGGTDATISSVTSGGANQNLNLMGSTLSLWTGTLGGLAYTERMRITPTGDVGIGNTSPSYKLDVTGTGRFTGALTLSASTGFPSVGLLNRSSDNNLYIVSASSGFVLLDNSQNTMYNATPTSHTWQISNSPKMTLNSSGNVGIGTSSPAALLDVNGIAYFRSASGIYTDLITAYSGGNVGIIYGASGNLIISGGSGATERMRITSGGNVAIGIAGFASTNERLVVRGGGSTSSSFSLVAQNVSGTTFIYVRDDGYLYSASAWSGSDLRLKENITDLDNGLDKILNLKARKFDFIDGFKNQYGFIAQELQEVIPDAVSVFQEEDEMLAIKMDFIVPHLVKALQESHEIIKDLEARIVTLESKIN
jgi:hypothetical protein